MLSFRPADLQNDHYCLNECYPHIHRGFRVVADVSTTALPGTSEGYLLTDSQLSDALEGPREEVCSFCVKVTGQLASVLADPDTAEETIAIMQGAVCPQLPGEL